MTSVSTQPKLDLTNTCKVSIQGNTEDIQCNIEQPKIDISENLEAESDKEISNECEYSISDQSKTGYSSNQESTSVSSPSRAAFVVYWSSLAVLLSNCLTCCLPTSVTNITLKGSQLILQLITFRQAQDYLEISTIGATVFKGTFKPHSSCTIQCQYISKNFKIFLDCNNSVDYKNKLLLNSTQIFSLCCQ